jgi:hypothetical protein
MIRVYRSLDLLEAEIVCQFLRSHDIDADVLSQYFLRQDWIRLLAYGGFHVVVTAENQAQALSLLKEWKAGEWDLERVDPSIEIDRVICPACGSSKTHENTWPRRALIVLGLFFLPVLTGGFRWHFKCDSCGRGFRAKPTCPHAELARRVDAASAEPQ